MNTQIREFFRGQKVEGGIHTPHFKDVRLISEETGIAWPEAERLGLPRGWYELSKVSPEDRVEFSRELWLRSLSFHPKATPVIEEFFDSLDDVVVVACRESEEVPWRGELVYSLADNSTFFRGLAPADEDAISWAKNQLEPDLPADFWAFFRLHNGFGRRKDVGLLSLEDLEEARDRLIDRVIRSEKPLRFGENWIDPYSLFPFYEEHGLGSFQCFNADWYPGSEMGNVYFSEIDYTLSDISERQAWSENLAHITFLEWMAAFLEGMNSCI